MREVPADPDIRGDRQLYFGAADLLHGNFHGAVAGYHPCAAHRLERATRRGRQLRGIARYLLPAYTQNECYGVAQRQGCGCGQHREDEILRPVVALRRTCKHGQGPQLPNDTCQRDRCGGYDSPYPAYRYQSVSSAAAAGRVGVRGPGPGPEPG